MKLAKDIIKKLKRDGSVAYLSRETARHNYTRKAKGKYIYIATSANLSKIRDACRDLDIVCRVHRKINKMTLALIINNKYIISPFIKTNIKNHYAVRKYSALTQDFLETQGYTLNAILGNPSNYKKVITDPNTIKDIKNRLIRTVGDPHKKITENRMHMLEAGKLLAELGSNWQVDFETFEAIQQRSLEIAIVSTEAIKEAFTDIMHNTERPSLAFRFYKNTGLLKELLPELLRGVGLPQSNKSNNLDLFNHIMYALDSIDKKIPNYEALRWACIFHDIAKPYTKSFDRKGNIHFYGHDKIGAIFATRWLEKHKFDRTLINKVTTICKHHLFDASLRLDDAAIIRLIKRIGKDNIHDLLIMRKADRYGTGRANISMKKIDLLKDRVNKLLTTL